MIHISIFELINVQSYQTFLKGLEEGQNEVEDCLESDHDEDDECDEKRRKVSKVSYSGIIFKENCIRYILSK